MQSCSVRHVVLSCVVGISVICRVPTAPGKPGKPGKMMKGFPVMEISWNFEILQNMEK